MLLTVHIGICDGNVHQVRGKQHNGLWLAGSAEWAALNNGAHWDQINKGYSFRWNWRNGGDESLLIQRLRKWFSVMLAWSHRKLLDIHILDYFFHNQFFSLSLHTCIGKCVQHRNRSEQISQNISSVLQCTVSSDQDPATILHCLSSIRIVSTQTKGLTNSDTGSLHVACHALSCPIIIRLTNGSLSTFLKDVLAMKLFEAQGPHINV